MPFKMLSAVSLCLIGANALADPGFYVGASLGRGTQNVDGRATGFAIALTGPIMSIAPVSVSVDSGKLAWTGTLGYRMNDYFAGELAYSDFGKTEVTQVYSFAGIPTVPGGLISAPVFNFPLRSTSEVTGPSITALGMLPLGTHWNLFLRGGMLFAEQKTSLEPNPGSTRFSDRVWIAGAGVDFNFASRWSARLEYQRTSALDANFLIGEDKIEHLALGVHYRL